MAKIKLGSLVADIRGKLGGHVFSKNKSGAYVRTKVTPLNPQTSSQSAVRSLFGSISSGWSQLTEAQRNSFRGKVSQFAGTNIFGDIVNPSGKTLYQKLNQNLANTNQAGVSVCPDVLGIPKIDQVEATFNTTSNTFSLEVNGDTTNTKLIVLATPPLSAGTKFVKNKLRQISIQNGGVDVVLDIKAAYETKFGAISANQNIKIGVKIVNAIGQASTVWTETVVFQA